MKQPKKEHIIRRLLWEARPIWKWLLLAALLCIGVIVCGVLGPKLLGGLIDRLYAWWDGSDRSDLLAGLLRPMGWLALVYLGYSLFSYVKMQLLNRVVSRYFTCELRIRISDKIRRLPVSYVDQTPVGDILSRMMDDVSTMGNYVHQIIDTLMTGFFMILAIAVMMLLEDWRLAAIVLVLTPASILLSTLLSSRSEKHFYSMFTESGNLNAVTEEAFTNFATTKAYNLEDYTEQRHAELNERRRKAETRANFTSSIVRPLIAFTNALAYIAICLFGGWLIVRNESVSVGIVVTILLYAKQFSGPLEQIAGGLGDLQHAKAAARRVFKLLDLPEEPQAVSTAVGKQVAGRERFMPSMSPVCSCLRRPWGPSAIISGCSPSRGTARVCQQSAPSQSSTSSRASSFETSMFGILHICSDPIRRDGVWRLFSPVCS